MGKVVEAVTPAVTAREATWAAAAMAAPKAAAMAVGREAVRAVATAGVGTAEVWVAKETTGEVVTEAGRAGRSGGCRRHRHAGML